LVLASHTLIPSAGRNRRTSTALISATPRPLDLLQVPEHRFLFSVAIGWSLALLMLQRVA